LLQILEDNKAKVTYTYDGHHNVLTSTTGEGVVYGFEYDEFGNNTKVTIGSGNTKISSEAHYYMDDNNDNNEKSVDGNYLLYTVDALGNITNYGYDPDTNTLEWVQYPNDTENTRTEYGYDAMFRTASAACTTDTGANMSVNYTYENDYLMSVSTPTTTYGFSYGDFGLRESVTVGSNTLATYTYDEDFYPERLDYGNGDSVEYKYEDGRKLGETYEDGDTVEYQYNNDGDLARIKDSATGRTTTQFYDLLGRPMKYEVTGDGYYHSVTYGYDTDNNLSTQVEVIGSVTTTTAYEYDDDNRVTSVTTGNTTVEYTYDIYGRTSQKVTKTVTPDATVKTETFTYTPVNGGTTSQVNTHRIVSGSMDKTYTYTYDDNGNILEVYDGTSTTNYEYDSANQLIRENNSKYNYTKLWTYDNAGNITSEKEYYHTTEDEPNEYLLLDTDTYGYPTVPMVDEGALNPVWGDLLTSYDGEAINYESTESSGVFGNPYNGNGRSYTWEHGRQLSSLTQNGTQWSFEYDAGGMRIKRTSDTKTYEYTYNGSQLTQMRVNGVTYSFTYDANGTPLTLTKEGDVYYYITNLQGDVIGLRDDTREWAEYTYDAWGVCEEIIGEPIGRENPLRYRGYIYDVETQLYYLQSRYYDPEIGRFINGDNYATTGQGFVGNNMFAYCGNNPVCRSDPSGRIWGLVIAVIAVAVVLSGCSSNTNEVLVMSNGDSGWMDSSAIMGDDMADAVDASSSRVEAITTENFGDIWNQATENHVIIHTHGSPNSLQGGNLNVKASDISLLQQNSNIKYVLITSCEVGGSNGNNANVGQLISQKIAPDGYVVCSTTIVSGGSKKFTATGGGRWIVYQNGVQISADFSTTITMKDVATYWH